MKRAYRIVFALMALLLLTGCQEKKTQAEIPLPEPEPPVTEQSPEPPMPQTARTQQERKTMDARLFSATVCTCLMEDSARWHLRELGIEAVAPSEDFSAAMEAFRALLPVQYAEDTFWLIDKRGDGLTLQFWKFDEGSHAGYFSCTDALYWESGTACASPIGESLVLDLLYFSPCAANAPEEERTRVEENYARLSENHASVAGWRVSLAPDGKLALMALDPERGGELFYACSQTSGPLVWKTGDVPEGENDELYRALCGVNFDESVVAADEQNLLRGFLASSLYAHDFIPWDGPRPVESFNDVNLAFDLKNAFWPLLRDFRADEAQAEDFLKNGPWRLFHDSGAAFRLTNEEGRSIEISAPLP